MTIEIINKNLRLDIHGFSGVAVNKDCVGTAFELMDKMWQAVKSNDLKKQRHQYLAHKPDEGVFAGVELYDTSGVNTG